jgi:hypothetical protein
VDVQDVMTAPSLDRMRSGWFEAALFLLAAAAGFASAALPWVTIRYGGSSIVASADHRYFGVAVGAVMLFLAVDVLARFPWQLRTHVLLAGAGSIGLGGLTIYDLVTGHARTTRQFTTYVQATVAPAVYHRLGPLDQAVQRLLHTVAWFSTGAGIYLALAAAVVGLAACLLSARSLNAPLLTAISEATVPR